MILRPVTVVFHCSLFAIQALCVRAVVEKSFSRSKRSAQHSGMNLSEPENALKEFISAINPIYAIIVGCLILTGCVFELVYGSRGSSPRSNLAHVASRTAPYSP